MNLALWISAGLLAAAHGGGWTGDAGVGFVRSLGAIELLAAVGLVLPAALGIAPVLVPLAAAGVVLLMVGAMITHLRRDEARLAVANLTYLALAAFVAWGRFGPESFTGVTPADVAVSSRSARLAESAAGAPSRHFWQKMWSQVAGVQRYST